MSQNMQHVQISDQTGGSIVFECSPTSAQRLATESPYRNSVFSAYTEQISNENSSDYSLRPEPVYTPAANVSELFGIFEDLTNSAELRGPAVEKASWLESDKKLLISIYKEVRPFLGKKPELKTKRKMWESISKKMIEKGVFFNANQVEGKWKSLERKFKKTVTHNKKTGRNRIESDKDMSEVLQGRAEVFAEYTLGPSGSGTSNSQALEAAGISEQERSQEEIPEEDTPSPETHNPQDLVENL